ncbi:MAG: Crp/Fnr family transcriptional regulator [Pseudomonadota bacterium]
MSQDTATETGLLNDIAFFGSLDGAERIAVEDICQRYALPIGQRFIHEGDTSRDLYILHRGAVRVLKQDNGEPCELASLRAETVFGEMALIKGEPRSATVEVIQPAELVRIDADGFHERLANNDLVAYKIAYAILDRLATRQAYVNQELLGLSAQAAAQCLAPDKIIRLYNECLEKGAV